MIDMINYISSFVLFINLGLLAFALYILILVAKALRIYIRKNS